jgi:hypothetical protein
VPLAEIENLIKSGEITHSLVLADFIIYIYITKYENRTSKLAHARSGDKGDTANVGVIALKDEFYPLLAREVTAEPRQRTFRRNGQRRGRAFELPNLGALNFLLHESLGGGGTLSLMTDAQGKTFSTALLRMHIEIGDEKRKI